MKTREYYEAELAKAEERIESLLRVERRLIAERGAGSGIRSTIKGLFSWTIGFSTCGPSWTAWYKLAIKGGEQSSPLFFCVDG